MYLHFSSFFDTDITGHSGPKSERSQPAIATDRNGRILKRPQTETATNLNGHIKKQRNHQVIILLFFISVSS